MWRSGKLESFRINMEVQTVWTSLQSCPQFGEGSSDFLDDPVVPFFSGECLQQDSATDFWLILELLSANSILIARHKRSMHMVVDNMWNRLANCFAKMEWWRLLAWKICFFAGIPECRSASGSQMCSSVGGWTLAGAAELTSNIFPLQQGQPGASHRVGQFGFCHPKADYLWLARGWAASAWMRRAEGKIVLREPSQSWLGTSSCFWGKQEQGTIGGMRNDSICFCRTHFKKWELIKCSAWVHVLPLAHLHAKCYRMLLTFSWKNACY